MNAVTIVLICIIFVLLIALFIMYNNVKTMFHHCIKLRDIVEVLLVRVDKIEKALDDDCWY